MYYRGAHAAIVVYDITCAKSFDEMHTWLDELERNMTQDLVVFVVGNKLDNAAERQVDKQTALEFVQKRLHERGELYEVSAKEDDGVEELFVNVARRLVDHRKDIDLALKKRNSEYIRLGYESSDTLKHNSSYCCT
jgi:Ras-related protein Rab-21